MELSDYELSVKLSIENVLDISEYIEDKCIIESRFCQEPLALLFIFMVLLDLEIWWYKYHHREIPESVIDERLWKIRKKATEWCMFIFREMMDTEYELKRE